jgi:hypothetical protein
MNKEITKKNPLDSGDVLGGIIGFVLAGVVGGSLLLFSCLMLFAFSVAPISNWMSAKSWDSADCVITRSDYKMAFTYEWEGVQYTSEMYDFASDFAHLHDGENEPFQEGSAARCFVNPIRPDVAILSKAFNASYLRGLIAVPPILFFLIIIYVYCVLPVLRIARWAKGKSAG